MLEKWKQNLQKWYLNENRKPRFPESWLRSCLLLGPQPLCCSCDQWVYVSITQFLGTCCW